MSDCSLLFRLYFQFACSANPGNILLKNVHIYERLWVQLKIYKIEGFPQKVGFCDPKNDKRNNKEKGRITPKCPFSSGSQISGSSIKCS